MPDSEIVVDRHPVVPSRFSRGLSWLSSRKGLGLSVLALLIAFIPALVTLNLVKAYSWRGHFLDDWMFGEMIANVYDGTFKLHELFAVQMEHRLVVSRVLAILTTWIFDRDLRVENSLAYLILLGTSLNVAWMLRRQSGLTWRQLWAPLLLMNLAFFSTAQWQTLLWPICFTSFLPAFFLSCALVVALSRWPSWVKFLGCALFALLGTLSFGSGIKFWVILLPVFWFCPVLPSRRVRAIFTGCWVAVAAVVLGLYFSNMTNEVHPNFAYGQGKENTLAHSSLQFFTEPLRAVNFVSAFLGGHLSRGLAWDLFDASMAIGYLTLAVYVGLGAFIFYRWLRKDRVFMEQQLPIFIFGTYSLGTAVAVAMGRMWLSQTVSQAVTPRYITHAIPLTVALVAILFLMGIELARRWPERQRYIYAAGYICLGLMAAWQVTVWIYGARLMHTWHAARLRGSAALVFADVMPDKSSLGQLSPDYNYVYQVAKRLEKHDLLEVKMIKDLRLDNFNVRTAPLQRRVAQFDGMVQNAPGKFVVHGFSYLKHKRRVADAVLFATWGGKDRGWEIFGMTQIQGAPLYLSNVSRKDQQFTFGRRFDDYFFAGWEEIPLTLFTTPTPGAPVSAWALDMEKMSVTRVQESEETPVISVPHGIQKEAPHLEMDVAKGHSATLEADRSSE